MKTEKAPFQKSSQFLEAVGLLTLLGFGLYVGHSVYARWRDALVERAMAQIEGKAREAVNGHWEEVCKAAKTPIRHDREVAGLNIWFPYQECEIKWLPGPINEAECWRVYANTCYGSMR